MKQLAIRLSAIKHALSRWLWREHRARGDVIMVRYADDSVIGFQHEEEAGQFLEAMRERFAKFGLALHPQKTRLIEFGRYAEQRRKEQGARSKDWEGRKHSTFSASRTAARRPAKGDSRYCD